MPSLSWRRCLIGLRPKLSRRKVSLLVLVYLRHGHKADLVRVGKAANKIQLSVWESIAVNQDDEASLGGHMKKETQKMTGSPQEENRK